VTSLRLHAPDGAELATLLTEPGLRDPAWGRAP